MLKDLTKSLSVNQICLRISEVGLAQLRNQIRHIVLSPEMLAIPKQHEFEILVKTIRVLSFSGNNLMSKIFSNNWVWSKIALGDSESLKKLIFCYA